MIKQIGSKWFVFGWGNYSAFVLGGPFDTEEDAQDLLDIYTGRNDPITAR